MPLNHITGERIQGRDSVYRVAPIEKYQQLSRLTTTVKELSAGKFKYEIEVERPVYEAALGAAQIAFFKAGADPRYLKADAIAQEYLRTNELAIIFCAKIGDKEILVPCVFQLTPEQIADLTVRNLWQPYRIH